MQQALDAAVKELAGLHLPKVAGFAVNAHNHAFLIGLVPGSWLENAKRSKEHLEVATGIVDGILKTALPVLERHIHAKRWQWQWTDDTTKQFGGQGAVLAFRWDD